MAQAQHFLLPPRPREDLQGLPHREIFSVLGEIERCICVERDRQNSQIVKPQAFPNGEVSTREKNITNLHDAPPLH